MNALDHQGDRHIPLAGATNFRDAGGYTTADGRTLRRGRLFRSDHLAALTDDDLARLRQLGVARSFDFRGERERADQAYDWPHLDNHHLPIEPTVVQVLKDMAAAGESITAARAEALMADTYRAFVNANSSRFAELFAHLLDAHADDAAVIHCTAGKDRTGLAVAFVHRALGVSRADLEADYLRTNDLLKMPAAFRDRAPPEVLSVLWRVKLDYLHAAFDAIERDQGGWDAYARQRLNLTPAAQSRLADLYLD